MKTIAFGIIMLAVAASGCADQDSTPEPAKVDQPVFVARVPQPQPTLPRAALQLLPDDLATAVRDTPPTVLVSAALTSVQEEALKAAFKLVKWPSREPVAAGVRIERKDPASGEALDRYVVVPEGELPAGWYALAVDLSNLTPELTEQAQESPWAGHLVTRFATHSTIVAGIDTKDEFGRTDLHVRLSSRVRDDRPGSALVRVTEQGRPVSCTGQNDPELAGSDGAEEVVLRCPALASPVVTVDADLRSLDGIPLGHAYSGPLTLMALPDRVSRRAALSTALRL